MKTLTQFLIFGSSLCLFILFFSRCDTDEDGCFERCVFINNTESLVSITLYDCQSTDSVELEHSNKYVLTIESRDTVVTDCVLGYKIAFCAQVVDIAVADTILHTNHHYISWPYEQMVSIDDKKTFTTELFYYVIDNDWLALVTDSLR